MDLRRQHLLFATAERFRNDANNYNYNHPNDDIVVTVLYHHWEARI